jgi:hypothetical protein
MGGMPMTISTQLSDQKCQNNFSEGGWRNCPTESDTLNRIGFTSQAWKDHNTQIAYYTVSTVRFPSVSNNILSIGFKGSCVNDIDDKNKQQANRDCPSIDKLNSISKLVELDKGLLIKNVKDVDKVNFFKNVLVPKVGRNQISLSQVKYGDYLWINSGGTNNHGLLVVGWGVMKDCIVAVSMPSGFSNFPAESPQKSLIHDDLTVDSIPDSIYVPFVVDYSYGTIANIPPLQSTVPRPFYCTRFDEKILQQGRTKFAGRHSWTFLNFPDVVKIAPQVLYADPTWQWTATSRENLEGILP